MKAKEKDKKEANAKLFSLVKVSFLKKSFVTAILVIAVLAMFTAAVAGADDPPCTCGDICVNETGWWRAGGDFNASNTPIQHAIDNATEGNTICVQDGTYNENVEVYKQLTIKSTSGNPADTIVNAADSTRNVFYITADYVNISGFTVKGTDSWDKAGIYLNGAEYCTISGNNASNNWAGIDLEHSCNSTIMNNTANSNQYFGIYLGFSSDNNTLINNTASSNRHGIDLVRSSNNTLANNNMLGNECNFGIDGETLPDYIQNIDTSNTVDGKPIYYWVDEQDQQIPNDAGFVGIVNSTNITVKDLILTKNDCGVLFAYTTNSRIENVTAFNNPEGISLDSSSNNTIANNDASNNGMGIYLQYSCNYNMIVNNTANSNRDPYDEFGSGIFMHDSCNYNMIKNNTISNNIYGIYMEDSSNYNMIVNNTINSNVRGGILVYYIHFDLPCNYNTIANNTLNGNPVGIHLMTSSGNILTNNTASNNGGGIFLGSSGNNTLTNNIMSGNEYNFGIYGEALPDYIQNIDTSNRVDGKPIYYWVDKQNQQIPNDAGFVGIVNSTNMTVRNLVLTNNYEGVLFAYTTNSRIENVTASNNEDGFLLYSSSNNKITNNNANWNHGEGISLTSSCNYNTITNNNANSNYGPHGIGVSLGSSSNNMLRNNTANSNDFFGISLDSSCDNTITNNTANSNVLYIGSYGIFLGASSDNTITNNTASNNNCGITLAGSSNNTLTNNTALNNADGIFLYAWNNYNTITNNNASNNSDYGIRLSSSSSNTIYNNYFNNTDNARDDGNNIWNITKTLGTNIISGPYLGGNYWSDYTGEDLDGDGLGDTLLPYNSSGSIQNGGDYLPLVPVQKPTVSITTDKFIYKTGDTMTITIDIYNPTENIVTFEWYWGVPQSDIWLLVTSVPIPAGYNDTINIRFSIPNRGSTPSGSVFYVQLLDGSDEVLDADVAWWTYSPGRFMEAMSVDLSKEIAKIIEKVELPA